MNCTAINDPQLLWAPLTGAGQVISGSTSAAPGGDTTRVPYRLTIPAALAPGSYAGDITFIAVPEP